MDLQKPTIYPTLVIGLGGTGTNVVRHVKRRILQHYGDGTLAELPQMIQVLAIDSEPLVNGATEQALHPDEFAYLGRFDGSKLIENKQAHAPYLDWWKWKDDEVNLGYIHNGARQLRPVGRLCFVRNYTAFRAAVKKKLARVNKLEAKARAEEDGYPTQVTQKLIFITGSICGGTGAGLLVDTARAIRDYEHDATIIAILAMPSVFVEDIQSNIQQRRIRANAYAALKEIHYLQNNSEHFKITLPYEDHQVPGTANKAFDQVFLVEMTDDEGIALSSKSNAEQAIAHFIQLTCLSDLGKTILARNVNVDKMEYSSFGVSSIVMPEQSLKSYMASRLLEETLSSLLKPSFEVVRPVDLWSEMPGVLEDVANESVSVADIGTLTNEVRERRGIWILIETEMRARMSEVLLKYGPTQLEVEIQDWLQTIESVQQTAKQPNGIYDVQRYGFTEKGNKPPQLAFSKVDRDRRAVASKEYALRYELELLAKAIDDKLKQILANVIERHSSQFDANSGLVNLASTLAHERHQQVLEKFDPDKQIENNSRYYDLETSALGNVDWDLINAWARYWTGQMTIAEADGKSEILPVQHRNTVTEILADWILDDLLGHEKPTGRKAEDLLEDIVRTEAYQKWQFAALASFSIRHVYGSRMDRIGGRSPRPANRAIQMHGRVGVHSSIDRDQNNFASANPEPIRIVSEPDATHEQKAFENRLNGHIDFYASRRERSDFEGAGSSNGKRVDACYILHGIPIDKLRGIDDLYRAYWGNSVLDAHPGLAVELSPRLAHLQPEWARDLPEVWTDRHDPDARKRKANLPA
jgi:hypothetical protein